LKSSPLWNKIKRKLVFKPLEILEKPRDGFPPNLADTPPEKERALVLHELRRIPFTSTFSKF
jgi:hypothetical protein